MNVTGLVALDLVLATLNRIAREAELGAPCNSGGGAADVAECEDQSLEHVLRTAKTAQYAKFNILSRDNIGLSSMDKSSHAQAILNA